MIFYCVKEMRKFAVLECEKLTIEYLLKMKSCSQSKHSHKHDECLVPEDTSKFIKILELKDI